MPTIEDLLTQIDFHFWKQRGRYSHSVAARLSENGFLLVRYSSAEFALYAFTVGGKTMCIGSVDGGHHFLPTQAKFQVWYILSKKSRKSIFELFLKVNFQLF
jgi:hypothetical protein